jgi:hypothetical protein
MVTPAALACSARTVAIATTPDSTGEVTRVTLRSSRPACLSRNFACGMSACRTRLVLKSRSNGENTSLARVPWPSRAESISCGRSTSSRIACRTRTSVKGAWSTRMVNGTMDPALETSTVTPGAVSRVGTWGGSRVPAAWTWPVISASASETVLGKSVMVSVPA